MFFAALREMLLATLAEIVFAALREYSSLRSGQYSSLASLSETALATPLVQLTVAFFFFDGLPIDFLSPSSSDSSL
jgi:hypothetical protein